MKVSKTETIHRPVEWTCEFCGKVSPHDWEIVSCETLHKHQNCNPHEFIYEFVIGDCRYSTIQKVCSKCHYNDEIVIESIPDKYAEFLFILMEHDTDSSPEYLIKDLTEAAKRLY